MEGARTKRFVGVLLVGIKQNILKVVGTDGIIPAVINSGLSRTQLHRCVRRINTHQGRSQAREYRNWEEKGEHVIMLPYLKKVVLPKLT